MSYGAVYIAHNTRDGDSTFKVGKTERPVKERMKELTSSTSNLGAYTACAYFVVYDIDAAEQACHRALRRYRVQANREFFNIPLSRLIRIVEEQVQAYAACSFVPEQERDNKPRGQMSAARLLKVARDIHAASDWCWDDDLDSARETISEWSLLIREKALQASEELQTESTLKWDIPASAGNEVISVHSAPPICSVTVFCLFSNEPLALWRRGIRGGRHGALDLSLAIGEPKVRTAHGDDFEFVEWKELDDGRIGRIELIPRIDHAMTWDKEGEIPPVPKMMVRATQIEYDDYRQDFKDEYHTEKTYSDPMEAFEVFLVLIVQNAKVPQYDVRKQREDGYFRRGRTREQPRISDRGKFEMRLLED